MALKNDEDALRSEKAEVQFTCMNVYTQLKDTRPHTITPTERRKCVSGPHKRSNEHRLMSFDAFRLSPMPLSLPGVFRLRLKVNVTQWLPKAVHVQMVWQKRIINALWMRVPCLGSYGSCEYHQLPVCLLTQDVFGCPIVPQYYDIDQSFIINSLDRDVAAVLQVVYLSRLVMSLKPLDVFKGDYKAVVIARHEITHEQLACLAISFSIIS
ncbi:unnamed protein product [Soboliphyme baturini]|uniref:DUF3707 domain-containing protein n=1 Tax=Soboliphyme baturini TaxID=241478 RepID=A0A183ILW7_9BILA|nr:unnamed protein product [Soboliphyme baturini]